MMYWVLPSSVATEYLCLSIANKDISTAKSHQIFQESHHQLSVIRRILKGYRGKPEKFRTTLLNW